MLDEGIAHYAASQRFTPADKVALRYSELMSTNPDLVDDALFNELRKYFTDDEIVELGVFIGINLGFHTFFGSLKFYPLFSPDGRLLTQAESEKLYGDKPVPLTRSAL